MMSLVRFLNIIGRFIVPQESRLVFGLQITLDESIDHVEPRVIMNKTEKSFSNLAASQFCFYRSNRSTTTLQF
jgi:hypothetical protein